jgi:hypothetical protein
VDVGGKELDATTGEQSTCTAAFSAPALTKKQLGSLNCMRRIVRLAMSVAGAPEFTKDPKVADRATEPLRGVLGEGVVSSRFVFGVASLPLGLPAETDIIVEV